MSKDAAATVVPVTISDCAAEPIHIPGCCQPFGVLISMKAGQERISQISKNSESVFGMNPDELVGRTLSECFGDANAASISDVFTSGNWNEVNPLKLTLTHGGKDVAVDVIQHRYNGLDFVEVEAVSAEGADRAGRSFCLVQTALTRLQRSLNATELWATVVKEVQRITGYDRVMVYKFDQDEHGSVVAEQKQDYQQSFLGLHYPASDIPEQARRLYRLNWVRYIPDIHYVPVDLLSAVCEASPPPVDMTHCVLRSVSPIHCEYLGNMGVGASLSVSIMSDDKLWGLIACHHDTARFLPYEFRSACELIGQMVSIRIAALEETEACSYKSKTNSLQAQFLAEFAKSKDLATALVSHPLNLLGFLNATGAAVCYGMKTLIVGRAPGESQIRMIIESTLLRGAVRIFSTERLQDHVFEAVDLTDTASGILCFTASRDPGFHVVWFRTEQVRDISWAGEPIKLAELEGTGLRLGPRRSFEVWKEQVLGKSQAWTPAEIEAAAELRSTLMSLLLSVEAAVPVSGTLIEVAGMLSTKSGS